MVRAARILALVVLSISLHACNRKPAPPEPTYQGLPRSEWLKLTEDVDANTRLAAFEAIRSLGGDESKAVFMRGLDDADDRIQLMSMSRTAGYSEAAPQIVAKLKGIAAADQMWWKRDNIYAIIIGLGKDGAALRPEIERALPLSAAERDQVNKLLDAIK